MWRRWDGGFPRSARASTADASSSCYIMCTIISVAQFIAVCSSAKPCEIGENLLSVSDPISRSEERLIHAGAFVRPPTLQRRTVSSLHPYAAVERSTTPVSPVPEPGHRSVGEVPLPPRVQTLLV